MRKSVRVMMNDGMFIIANQAFWNVLIASLVIRMMRIASYYG